MHSQRHIPVFCAASIAASLALFIASPQAVAQAAAPAPHAVVADTSHDFGRVEQGAKLVHHFVVRNTGGAPLTLSRLSLSQPAMSAKIKPEILPGGEAALSIEWNTAGLHGAVEGRAVLELNDPASPVLALVLTADVKQPIEFTPYPAVYASLYQGESARRTLRVDINRERPLAIGRLEQQGEHFQATVRPVVPGRSYELEVNVPATTSPGRYSEAVFLYTDDPQLPRLMVPVNVLVKTELYANPEKVDFGKVALAQLGAGASMLDLLTQSFIVRKRAGRFSITGLTSDLPFLSLRRLPDAGEAEGFRIDVALSKDGLRPGPISGSITLLTDDKQFPRLVIPVSGEVQ
jgi:hypothetical protein